MFSIVLIMSCSVVLFAYWFRYSCLLILQTRSRETNAALRPFFPASQDRMPGEIEDSRTLEQTHKDLKSDYRMLRFMLAQASDLTIDPIERRMLMLDYNLMRLWFYAMRYISEGQARGALEEMSTIQSFFSQSLSSQHPGRV